MDRVKKVALIGFIVFLGGIALSETGIFSLLLGRDATTSFEETAIFLPHVYPLLEIPEFRKVYPDSEAVILSLESIESSPVSFEISSTKLFDSEFPDAFKHPEIDRADESGSLLGLELAPPTSPSVAVKLYEPKIHVRDRLLYKVCEVNGHYEWSTRVLLSSDENFFDITAAGRLKVDGTVKYYGLMSSAHAANLAQSYLRATVQSKVEDELKGDWKNISEGKFKQNLMQAGDWSKPSDSRNAPTSQQLEQLDSLLLDEKLQSQERLERLKSLMAAHPEFLKWRDTSGCTPLHQAVRSNQPEVVKWLLSSGAELDAVDHHRETPLHTACLPRISKEIASLLIEGGADTAARNRNGETPLHHATFFGKLDHMTLLLEAGADPNIRGREMLLVAENPNTIALLLKWGADPNVVDDEGKTPLVHALEKNNFEITALLLKNAADPGLAKDSVAKYADTPEEKALLENT